MRLSDREASAIRAAAIEAFGPNVVVRLFGSRLDDGRRGGDIDLHLQLSTPPPPRAEAAFRRLLDRSVGERDYDILIAIDGNAPSGIDLKAVAEGIVL